MTTATTTPQRTGPVVLNVVAGVKFTGPGRTAIYGRTDYPEVGVWSDERRPEMCIAGWHVFNAGHLSTVVGGEAWQVELGGSRLSDREKTSYERIRFLRQLPWSLDDLFEFAQWAAGAAIDYGDVEGRASRLVSRCSDAHALGDLRKVAYWATMCAGFAVGEARRTGVKLDVRQAQSEWITERLERP